MSEWVKVLIARYFGECGLEDIAYKHLEELPERLARHLGKSPEFWRNELLNENSSINRLNLIEGAVKWVCKRAEANSRKFGRDICDYLRKALIEGHISNWISKYLKILTIDE